MSIVDERDLRQQLGGVLDAIALPEPPVKAAARKGKLIQAGRSLGIVSGVAVVVGMGVSTPGLLNQAAREVSHAQPTVMVEQICTTASGAARGTSGADSPGLAAVRAGSSAAESPAGSRPGAEPTAGELPTAQLTTGELRATELSAGELPTTELSAGGCAWLRP